jgi:hypothetical protein
MPVILFGREMNSSAHSFNAGKSIAAGIVFLAMLFAAFALWTVIPLCWVFIASKASHTQFPSIGPYLVVVGGILISVLIDAWIIGRLNALYIRITGTNRLSPGRATWLRSMRDTGSSFASVTVVEAVMMSSVLLAAIALTLWFFFLSGSPIPNN